MRTPFRIAAPFAMLGIALVVACAEDEPLADDRVLGDGGGAPGTLDARTSPPDAESPVSTMRLAHLAPGIGEVDFCYQAARTGMRIGPVLGSPRSPPLSALTDAGGDADAAPALPLDASLLSDASGADADAGDALPPTVAYRTVSKYYNLQAAGPITIAIVPAGATSCASALVTADVTLAVDRSSEEADGDELPRIGCGHR